MQKTFKYVFNLIFVTLFYCAVAFAEPKTTIVATIGPATSSAETVKKMIHAGLDYARVNFSHGSYESNAKLIEAVRIAAREMGKNIPIIVDLQGPKYRIGKFENKEVELVVNQSFTLDLNQNLGNKTRVMFNYPELYTLLSKDGIIFLNDGAIILKITSVTKDSINAVVEKGGLLSNNKGVNLPTLNTTAIKVVTPKDKEDVNFALQNIKPDYFALSFVNNAQNVNEFRKLIGKNKVKVIAKIETSQALEHLDEIVKASDAVMVARGDMGIEIGLEKVPVMQKRIIASAKRHNKLVIVATQMMESMVNSPLPTRAEVSDVAFAVYLDADSVMLSGETAVGKYPVETVEMMNKILSYTEKNNEKGTCMK